MYWFLAVVAILVVGLGVLAYQGHLGGMPPLVEDRPGPDLPASAMTGDDLRGLRFAVVTRGYSMAQVDDLIDRLADQLDGRPVVIRDDVAEWAGEAAPAATVPAPPPPPVPAGVAEAPEALGWPVTVPERS